MIDPIDIPQMGDRYARSTGAHRAGCYHLTAPALSTATVNTLGTALRVTPFPVPRRITITRMGLEVVNAGDAGCVMRMGIYADNGAGYPDALVLDAGTVPGDAVGVAEVTISKVLEPGTYWCGAVPQGVTSVQPTIRGVASLASPLVPLTTGAIPGANHAASVGFAGLGVTGALPATFPTGVNLTATAARMFVKVA